MPIEEQKSKEISFERPQSNDVRFFLHAAYGKSEGRTLRITELLLSART